MRPARLVRTSAFRYALIYAVLVSLTLAGALGLVWWRTSGVIAAQIDDTIEAEIRGLAERYDDRGLAGLTRTIAERAEDNPGLRNIYLLTGPAYRRIAGNLDAWPEAALGPGRWVDFAIRAPGDADQRQARARTFRLAGDLHLLVGRDTTERAVFRRLVAETSAVALGLGAVLALAVGLVASGVILRRVDAMGREARAILAGDLARRMPDTGTGDEFDRLADQLNRMLDRIEDLMAGMRGVADDIAHDLRTPIGRLRSRAELALMQADDPETLRRALEETIEEADAILRTFNALLGIARAESGADRAAFATVDLAQIARDAVDLYGPAAEEAGCSLTVEAAAPVPVHGDESLLANLVGNLLDNAVTHAPAAGRPCRIAVTVTPAGDGGPSLSVADTGPGIPAAERDRVTDRFVRLEASRHSPGSGLGLALVAAIAMAHGASLSLDDTPGGGLTVRVGFPVPQDGA